MQISLSLSLSSHASSLVLPKQLCLKNKEKKSQKVGNPSPVSLSFLSSLSEIIFPCLFVCSETGRSYKNRPSCPQLNLCHFRQNNKKNSFDRGTIVRAKLAKLFQVVTDFDQVWASYKKAIELYKIATAYFCYCILIFFLANCLGLRSC